MRWWKLWLGGTIIALTAVLGALTLTIPPAPPFDFLRGRTPTRSMPKTDGYGVTSEFHAQPSSRTVIYSFRADYDKVNSMAERELKGKGFFDLPEVSTLVRTDRSQYVHFPPSQAGFPDSSHSPRRHQVVQVLRDMVVKEQRAFASDPGSIQIMTPKPGWVTVVIEGLAEKEPDWFDNLRAWLGF